MYRPLILESKVGRFFFYRDTVLSQAKLIRDTVTAAILNPQGNGVISTPAQAYAYITNIPGPIRQVPFSVEFHNPANPRRVV